MRILDEQVLYSNGKYKRVRRWLEGKHPHLGKLHHGWTGWETIQEVDVIEFHTFDVSHPEDARCLSFVVKDRTDQPSDPSHLC